MRIINEEWVEDKEDLLISTLLIQREDGKWAMAPDGQGGFVGSEEEVLGDLLWAENHEEAAQRKIRR